MSSAARIAALCVSTIGPCDRTSFNAWSTYAATSRVYSGGRSDRRLYSSPPIITLTACFWVLPQAPPEPPALWAPPVPPPFPPVWRACSSRKVSRDNRSCTRVRAPSTRWRNVRFSCSRSATRPRVADLEQENRDRKSTRLNSSHLVISYAVFFVRKRTRLNSSHLVISYAVFCLKNKIQDSTTTSIQRRQQHAARA